MMMIGVTVHSWYNKWQATLACNITLCKCHVGFFTTIFVSQSEPAYTRVNVRLFVVYQFIKRRWFCEMANKNPRRAFNSGYIFIMTHNTIIPCVINIRPHTSAFLNTVNATSPSQTPIIIVQTNILSILTAESSYIYIYIYIYICVCVCVCAFIIFK